MLTIEHRISSIFVYPNSNDSNNNNNNRRQKNGPSFLHALAVFTASTKTEQLNWTTKWMHLLVQFDINYILFIMQKIRFVNSTIMQKKKTVHTV